MPGVRKAPSWPVSLGLLLGLAAAPAAAQSPARITGAAHFDITSGALRGEACAPAPETDGTGRFELNSRLSPVLIDGAPPRFLSRDPVPGGDAIQYRVQRAPAALPGSTLCVTWAGTVPRFPDQQGGYRAEDHSGVLAFDGRNLRARGAARWLPFPIDPENGMAPEAVAVDITVTCDGCTTIYLNGFDPVRGSVGRFSTTYAREPFLLVGDLPVRPTAGGWIVAPDSLWARSDSILRIVRRIDQFYQRQLGTQERARIDLIAFPEVRQPARGRAWAFLPDPALALEAGSIAAITRALTGDRRAPRENAFSLLAHEAAHRYFGWRLGRRSPQRDLFGEPLATLLELEAVREFLGPETHASRLADLRASADQLDDAVPLASATTAEFAEDTYRYAYAPAMLLEMVEPLGPGGVNRLLNALLDLPPASADRATLSTIRQLITQLGASLPEQ